MKKLLLLALAACLPFSIALAQDAANFHLTYGNADGSVLAVGLDRDIEIQAWGATDPTPGNPDSVTFMHNPLKSDDLYITARNGGFFPAYGVGLWDDRSFLNPDVTPGFHSQSILGFAYLTDPRDPQNFFYTLGAQQLIGTFRMHTASDPAYIDQTVCPFSEGANPANGGTTWGMQDGVRGVNPTKAFGCIFFSPNAPPVWTSGNAVTLPPYGCIQLSGTDSDLLNTLTITGPGGVVVATGGNGSVSGEYCGSFTDGQVVHFDLSDGTDIAGLDVTVTVTCGNIGTTSALSMNCPDAIPGGVAEVFISLYTEGCVGGFELMIRTDPTALNLVSVTPMSAINNGAEYFNWVADPNGAGTDRFVWVANINNGIDTPPMFWGSAAQQIVKLTYAVTSGLPWDMAIPVTFDFAGPDDYTSNTISDETGYQFIHPGVTAGCVHTVNPASFKGDPNMNGWFYEVADVVLVARRLIAGNLSVFTINAPVQEAASDLNDNGFADIADLVRFVNILNGFIVPKLDPISGQASIYMDNGIVSINSPAEVGAALVRINHSGNIGTPVVASGMEVLTQDVNGVLSVLVYSMAGNRIPAGNQTLFTISGDASMNITEASASDAYGRLLDASAHMGAPLPTEFAVNQNYPNPFNAKTLINFALPTASDVTVNIYSITGQLVETLGGHFDAGMQSITWDASNVSSGIYFYKVQADGHSQTMKMTLLK